MGTTANYSWPTPVATDLVKDGWEAIKDLGDAADTTVKAVSDAQGLVHINTTSFSGAVSHSFGSDASPIFTSDYTNYRIILDNVKATSSYITWSMRLRANTTDNTNNEYLDQNINANNTSLTAARSAAKSSFGLGAIGFGNDSSVTIIEMFNPQTANRTNVQISNMQSAGNNPYLYFYFGAMTVTTAYNGFTIFASENKSGNMSVYGYQK